MIGRVLLVALHCLAVAGLAQTSPVGWYRGQLHAHSYWSDGRAFPEQVIVAYRQRGYEFLSLTDHNLFASDTNQWREVRQDEGGWPPKISGASYDRYAMDFDKESRVTGATNQPVTSVRLKTYAEVKARYEQPGKFLLLPGVELTQSLNGRDLHLNYINLPVVLPCIQGGELIKNVKGSQPVSDLIARNATEARQAAVELRRPHLLILNHPFWRYYDIVPQNLIENPQVRFFEVCNNGGEYAPNPQAAAYTLEQFWDAVNAFRRLRGDPLLYGIGTDDAHHYDAKRITGRNGVGDAWVMVRAAALTPEDLIAAMQRGDFYASSGVLLDEVTFQAQNNTLQVRVKTEPGVHYTIHFITTKRGFNQKVTEVVCPAENKRPARTVPLYSEDIGRIVKTVTGPEARTGWKRTTFTSARVWSPIFPARSRHSFIRK